MSRIIAAINMTLDGFCDHTAISPGEEIHQHYADLLHSAGTLVYGRTTYQLMEYWRTVVKEPTGNKATDEFALVMDSTPKIVFSRTLKSLDWETARLASQDLEAEITALRQQPGKDVLVGSPGLIISMLNLGLIDEFQLCIHPVLARSGSPLFANMNDTTAFTLIKTKVFSAGAVVLYYEPIT